MRHGERENSRTSNTTTTLALLDQGVLHCIGAIRRWGYLPQQPAPEACYSLRTVHV